MSTRAIKSEPRGRELRVSSINSSRRTGEAMIVMLREVGSSVCCWRTGSSPSSGETRARESAVHLLTASLCVRPVARLLARAASSRSRPSAGPGGQHASWEVRTSWIEKEKIVRWWTSREYAENSRCKRLSRSRGYVIATVLDLRACRVFAWAPEAASWHTAVAINPCLIDKKFEVNYSFFVKRQLHQHVQSQPNFTREMGENFYITRLEYNFCRVVILHTLLFKYQTKATEYSIHIPWQDENYLATLSKVKFNFNEMIISTYRRFNAL
jgi:hypothetical protein